MARAQTARSFDVVTEPGLEMCPTRLQGKESSSCLNSASCRVSLFPVASDFSLSRTSSNNSEMGKCSKEMKTYKREEGNGKYIYPLLLLMFFKVFSYRHFSLFTLLSGNLLKHVEQRRKCYLFYTFWGMKRPSANPEQTLLSLNFCVLPRK